MKLTSRGWVDQRVAKLRSTCRLVILIFTIGTLLWPSSLLVGPGETPPFPRGWPQVIMDTGSLLYVMEKPGGKIKCLNIKHIERKE